MIPLFKVFMSPSTPTAVGEVLMSGFIGQGEKVDTFEAMLREYFNYPFINTVNSCTSGLELALQMIKSDNAEVITTPLTCTATNFAILSRGLKLKWADINSITCNLDLDDVARKVNENTCAIMAVHWGGYPVDLDRLKSIQMDALNKYGKAPAIIEDCAHAWGSKYKNKLIGTHGNHAVFSFQAIKHLTTGDGGIIVSPNDNSYQRAKLLRWYGLDRTSSKDFRCSQNIKEPGFKWHMNDIAATIGMCNMEHIDKIVETHKSNGQYYNKKLQNVAGVELLENDPNFDSSYWIYTMMVENRNDFIKKMKEKGIVVGQVHDRNDKHDCLSQYKTDLPNMDKVSQKMICIPCGWWVSKEDRQHIVNCIKEGW